jgi:hypothetical protein
MADNSIDKLIDTFDNMGGAQRANRYEVIINPPTALGININTPFIASSVQVPTHITEYYQDTMAPSGSYLDIPIKRQFDQMFKIDFIVDYNWNIRQFFENWVDLIFNRQTGETRNSVMVNYYDNIVGTIIINALDQNGDISKTITLYDAWPGTIMPAMMSNDIQNNYLTLQIDMNYRNYDLS